MKHKFGAPQTTVCWIRTRRAQQHSHEHSGGHSQAIACIYNSHITISNHVVTDLNLQYSEVFDSESGTGACAC